MSDDPRVTAVLQAIADQARRNPEFLAELEQALKSYSGRTTAARTGRPVRPHRLGPALQEHDLSAPGERPLDVLWAAVVALRLLREARQRSAPDRRRALALRARLLPGADAPLGRAARDLAWSEPPPERDAVDEIVTQVERERAG